MKINTYELFISFVTIVCFAEEVDGIPALFFGFFALGASSLLSWMNFYSSKKSSKL